MNSDTSKIDPLDAICYARFSPRPKKKRGLAVEILPAEKLELQQEQNRAYCDWKGLVARFPIDEPYTSAYESPLAERDKGPEIIRLFDGGCKHIVACKLDRIFRNTRDGLYWLDEGFPKYGVTLHIADQRGVTLRTDTADGYLTAVMLLTMATVEPMRTRERTSRDMLNHQMNGRAMGGNAPYGWSREGDRLTPNPTEQATLLEIHQLHDGGLSDHEIATVLNAAGKLARNGTPWQAIKIQRQLERRERVPTHA